MPHPFILQPYNGMATRFRCPECQNHHKTFSKYINTVTGEQVNDIVGRCSRENNCGYHFTPKQFFHDHNQAIPNHYINNQKSLLKIIPAQPSYIDPLPFQQSLKNYDANHFVQYLINLFGTAITQHLVQTYCIGTSRHWPGASIFWQIDNIGKIRTGKIMLYSPTTGKRVKEPYNHITWVHKQINQPNYHLMQCLFGLHLLKGNAKPIAIVESEKTAIISSVYLPQFIWLAAGSLCNLSKEKCHPLKGRNVTLFPDLNGYGKWQLKSTELAQTAKFTVSGLLENFATADERQAGLDLADYLIRFPIEEFKKSNAKYRLELAILRR